MIWQFCSSTCKPPESKERVGTLAQVYFAQGIYESADEFVPEYLRKSQAEREREERLHGQK